RDFNIKRSDSVQHRGSKILLVRAKKLRGYVGGITCRSVGGGAGPHALNPSLLTQRGVQLRTVGLSWTRARFTGVPDGPVRSEEHTSELQSRENLVCRLL